MHNRAPSGDCWWGCRAPTCRVKDVITGIRDGKHYRIHACCVTRFVIRNITKPGAKQARERGVAYDEHGPYIPCLVFHTTSPTK